MCSDGLDSSFGTDTGYRLFLGTSRTKRREIFRDRVLV